MNLSKIAIKKWLELTHIDLDLTKLARDSSSADEIEEEITIIRLQRKKFLVIGVFAEGSRLRLTVLELIMKMESYRQPTSTQKSFYTLGGWLPLT